MLRSQSDNQQRCTRSSVTDIILPKFHLDVAKKSFYYHGALAFNSLPMNIKTLPPKDRFLSYLRFLFMSYFFRTFYSIISALLFIVVRVIRNIY